MSPPTKARRLVLGLAGVACQVSRETLEACVGELALCTELGAASKVSALCTELQQVERYLADEIERSPP